MHDNKRRGSGQIALGQHDEAYTDGSKINESGGSSSPQPSFSEWWDELPPAVQNTPK